MALSQRVWQALGIDSAEKAETAIEILPGFSWYSWKSAGVEYFELVAVE
jgi:hypothetical protein